jgi:hypothetical protein
MGLDMYLTNRDKKTNQECEAGYWRKANQIHSWFVNNCQGGVDKCQETLIHKSQLEDLLITCIQVQKGSELKEGKVVNGYRFDDQGNKIKMMEDGKVIVDPSTAQELLPSSSGFFFGGTEYDEWYYRDVEETINIIKKVLESTDFTEEEIYYQASW